MMSERDRLIELMREAELAHLEETIMRPHTISSNEFLADYLLANGVIVPPCKVGDIVYVVDYTRLGNMIFECTIEEISHFTYGTYYYLNWGLHIPRFKACQEKSFGKTIFFTKEEAEQALKGGAE